MPSPTRAGVFGMQRMMFWCPVSNLAMAWVVMPAATLMISCSDFMVFS